MELINQIDETFKFQDKDIRVIGNYNEPLFAAKDICTILELSNITEALRNIPEKWRTSEILKCVNGQNMNMIVLKEPAVYQLIMRSTKPMAKAFQEAVCEDILPTLRKKGEYKIQSIIDRNKELEEEKLKIEEDNKRLEEEKNKKEEELTKLTKKYVKPPKEVIDGMNFVYLITSEEKEVSGEFVIGKSLSLTNRKDDYNQEKLHNHKIIYYRSFKSPKIMDIAESLILSKFGKYRCKAGRDVFQLPEFSNISLFTDLFDKCFDILEDIEEEHVIFPKRTPIKNVEEQREKNAVYQMEHYDEIREKQREYREINADVINEVNREKYAENPEKILEKNKKYYEKNREELIESAKEYYYDRKEEILEERKEFYKDNKEHILEERKEYYKENYKTKIAKQRQKKETCECGMIVSHYCMKNHQKSERHRVLMAKLSREGGGGDFAKIVIVEDDDENEEEE